MKQTATIHSINDPLYRKYNIMIFIFVFNEITIQMLVNIVKNL